jgi:predicted permease
MVYRGETKPPQCNTIYAKTGVETIPSGPRIYIMHDLRYAIRLLAKNWTFTLTVTLILALCIGANTAVLSVVNAAMVKPLDYPDPDRLVQVVRQYSRNGGTFQTNVDGFAWELIRDRAPALEIALSSGGGSEVNLGVNGGGVLVHQQRVSAGFFHVLGIAPEAGREFTREEDRDGGPAAAMLSEALWKHHFSGDAGVIGRTILLRGEPYTVIGIVPAGFQWEGSADVWTPLRPSTKGEGGGTNYQMIARIAPGASWQQAQSQLTLLDPELRAHGNFGRDVRMGIVALQEGVTRQLRNPLKILWIAVAALFVLGVVNIGGMLLARSSGRTSEIATRLALGASAGRIVRQLLIESVALSLWGGLAGAGTGAIALDALRSLGGASFPFLKSVELDARVLLATLALTLLAGIAFGLFPAWQASRTDLRSAGAGSRSVAGRRRFISLGALVAGQVALAVPLLVGAGLLLHTFLYLWNQNPGFDANHVLTARFSMQDARYATTQKINQFYEEVLTRLRETPGIDSAAVTLTLPYERAVNAGFRMAGSTEYQHNDIIYATPDYFRVLRVPLLDGRVFTESDGSNSEPVGVVNEAFASYYFKGQRAAGQMIQFDFGKAPLHLIGVVGNMQAERAGWGNFGPIAHVPTVFIPAAQLSEGPAHLLHVFRSPSFIVRGTLPGRETNAALESAVRSTDPLLPIAEFRSINDLKLASLDQERFMAALVDSLGALAILLTALGIYGLIANLVTERTKELGIRIALGSSTGLAIQTALRPGLIWVLAGAIAGSVASLALGRFLQSFIFGIGTTDPLTLGSVAIGILLATLLAAMIPASRIARLNPADTLRAE